MVSRRSRSIVAAGVLLFLLCSCPLGTSQTMPAGIQVEMDRDKPFTLNVELRSGAETGVTLFKNRLPWGSAYSMILIAVMPTGECVKKELRVDDPSPEQVSLAPNKSMKGNVDLRQIFRDLDVILRKSDVQLFWAYEAPEDLHIPHWSGGWILIPKRM